MRFSQQAFSLWTISCWRYCVQFFCAGKMLICFVFRGTYHLNPLCSHKQYATFKHVSLLTFILSNNFVMNVLTPAYVVTILQVRVQDQRGKAWHSKWCCVETSMFNCGFHIIAYFRWRDIVPHSTSCVSSTVPTRVRTIRKRKIDSLFVCCTNLGLIVKTYTTSWEQLYDKRHSSVSTGSSNRERQWLAGCFEIQCIALSSADLLFLARFTIRIE